MKHMKGRKPIASNEKEMRGTYRPDRDASTVLPTNTEPTIQSPNPPTWLLTSAKKIWKIVIIEMVNLGIYFQIDQMLLAAYCQEMGVYVDCMKQIKRDKGPVVEFQNGEQVMNIISPHSKAATISLKNAIGIAKELGLTALSRTRIQTVILGENQADYDEFRDI